jgi:hypothetical protein
LIVKKLHCTMAEWILGSYTTRLIAQHLQLLSNNKPYTDTGGSVVACCPGSNISGHATDFHHRNFHCSGTTKAAELIKSDHWLMQNTLSSHHFHTYKSCLPLRLNKQKPNRSHIHLVLEPRSP